MNHAAGAKPISTLFNNSNNENTQKRSSPSSPYSFTTTPLIRDGNVPSYNKNINNFPSSPPSQIPYRRYYSPLKQYQNNKWRNTNYQQYNNRRNYIRIIDRNINNNNSKRHVRQTKKSEKQVIGKII
jgi:hypothetical protein